MYCRICGQDPARSSAALFRVEAGVRHLRSAHGIMLADK